MDTIYTEWSCMAAALTAGMTLMMVYDGLRLFRLFVRHAPFWTGLEDLDVYKRQEQRDSMVPRARLPVNSLLSEREHLILSLIHI